MWRPTMFFFCLTAALAGTPLRQSEAADDFARAIADFGQGDAVETIDGGVGDDQEVSILKSGGDAVWLAAMILHADAIFFLAPDRAVSRIPVSCDCRSSLGSPPPAASSVRRFAWLQFFLF